MSMKVDMNANILLVSLAIYSWHRVWITVLLHFSRQLCGMVIHTDH